MKGVISYRTDDLDELKKIAKIRNLSLSTLTGQIIHDYLNNHSLIKKYDMFLDGKKFISAAFENLDPAVFDKVIEVGTKECTRGAKKSMNDFCLENLMNYFKGWIESNSLKLSEFDENDRIKWICETNMGEKYNIICVQCFKNVLENFSFNSNINSVGEDDFELIILKKNNKR